MQRIKFSSEARNLVKAKTGGKCGYCGEPISHGHIDHIKPLCQGGTNEIENLLYACAKCNRAKSGMTPRQFRDSIYNSIPRLNNDSLYGRAKRFGLVTETKNKIKFYYKQFGE